MWTLVLPSDRAAPLAVQIRRAIPFDTLCNLSSNLWLLRKSLIELLAADTLAVEQVG
jgi:hypothetical protein